MSDHKARERREIRMAEEAKERARMVALMAAVLAARIGREDLSPNNCRQNVQEARMLLDAAYEAESLLSPFPEGSTLLREKSDG